jgi:hypothetical protein
MSAAKISRTQLTLFVPAPWGTQLDSFRRVLDPAQASLIASHVTLCREDEIAELDPSSIFARVASWQHGPAVLDFGLPQRFSGHGVLLPCVNGSERFQALRKWLLQDQGARAHEAHITLAHPRNTRSPSNTDATLEGCPRALHLAFPSVALIEQEQGSNWAVVRDAALGGARRSDA